MISYNVIIGDTATKVFIRVFDGERCQLARIDEVLTVLTDANNLVTQESILLNRNTVVFASTLFITLPLSLQKNITRLNKVRTNKFANFKVF